MRWAVKTFYGYNGHCSEDPIVIVELMFLLFFEDVKSERELMRIMPLLRQHERNTGEKATPVVADSQYGTQDYLIGVSQNVRILLSSGFYKPTVAVAQKTHRPQQQPLLLSLLSVFRRPAFFAHKIFRKWVRMPLWELSPSAHINNFG